MANIYEDRIDPPQSRIEERLRRIEKMIEEGGGGGHDSPTASDEDIEDIKDHTWPDDEETASQEDIDSIKDGIWGN